MSDLFTTIEDALLAMLQAAPGLVGIQTWETTIRECLFAGDKLTRGFSPGELPAINVTAQLKPSRSRPCTAGEKEYEVPVNIVIVTRAGTAKDALRDVYELKDAVESVLDQARRSGNALGANTIVSGDVTADAAAVKDTAQVFAVCTVETTVKMVVEL